MESLLVAAYFIAFAVIAGGAFALMTQNLRSGRTSSTRQSAPRHPEAPRPGETVMVVDLNRERLEQLYQQSS